MQFIKCVAVGDNNAGKSSLLYAYANQKKAPSRDQLSFEDRQLEVTVADQSYKISLYDTVVKEELRANLRPLTYLDPEADVFLLCFSVISRSSLERIKSKWLIEVEYWCPTRSYLLVGNKTDLRDNTDNADSDLKPISYEEGCSFADEIGAVKYVECSAYNFQGLGQDFHEAIVSASKITRPKPKKKKTCTFL